MLEGLRQQVAGLRLRYRFADQVALDLVTMQILQKTQLLFGLDPFGHHPQPQAVAHGNDGTDQCRIAGAFGEVGDEGAIDFDFAQRKPLEVTQG